MNKKTILITGASSGIGRGTALYFQKKGWNVAATMRSPEKETHLTALENVLVTKLDVTDEGSIQASAAEAVARFGQIDVLLNNAGYAAYGPLEAFSMEKIKRQFDTNVIGLLAVTKALLPQMRAQKSGHIINISSIGGQMTFPLGTLYHGSKFAVEGLSDSLHYELKAFGVKVKIIEPGMIKTDFAGRSMDFVNDESMSEYQTTVQNIFSMMGEAAANASEPEIVAGVIWTAVTDGSDTLRYRAGDDAVHLLDKRKAENDETFFSMFKST